jgi:hypothetical protein
MLDLHFTCIYCHLKTIFQRGKNNKILFEIFYPWKSKQTIEVTFSINAINNIQCFKFYPLYLISQKYLLFLFFDVNFYYNFNIFYIIIIQSFFIEKKTHTLRVYYTSHLTLKLQVKNKYPKSLFPSPIQKTVKVDHTFSQPKAVCLYSQCRNALFDFLYRELFHPLD